MKTTTGNTGMEVLGIRSEELIGSSADELKKMIDEVQSGIQGETLSEDDRNQAAEDILREQQAFTSLVMSQMGRRGGSSTSEAKKKSSAENGKKGGRPPKKIG